MTTETSSDARRLTGHVHHISLLVRLAAIVAALLLLPGWLAAHPQAATPVNVAAAIVLALAAAWCVSWQWPVLRHAGPTILLDPEGIEHVWYGRVPWSAVTGIGFGRHGLQGTARNVFVLAVREPGVYLRRMPWPQRLWHAHRRLDAARGTLPMPLDGLGVRPGLVRERAYELCRQATGVDMAARMPTMTQLEFDSARTVDAERLLIAAAMAALDPESRSSEPDTAQFARIGCEVQAEFGSMHEYTIRQKWIATGAYLLVAAAVAVLMWASRA